MFPTSIETTPRNRQTYFVCIFWSWCCWARTTGHVPRIDLFWLKYNLLDEGNYRLCRMDSYLWRPPSRSRSLLPAVASICTDICSRDPNCNGAHLHPASTNIDTKIPKNIHKYYWIGASPCTDVYRRAPGSAPSPPCRLSDTLTKSDSHGQGNVRRWKFSSGLPVRTSHQCCTASLSSCLHLSHEVAQYLLCLRIGLVRTMARCCTCNGSLPASSQLASPDRPSQIHKCKYKYTNIHIRIHKYEYTNTNKQIRGS